MTSFNTSKRGRFITLEGGEGTGKSTQVRHLVKRLAAAGLRCVETREPGGSPFAERIREIILDPATPQHPPLSEALLFSAARADHVATTINPALLAGSWVICDRYIDSTRAYQGAAGGLPASTVAQLEDIVVGDTKPDLTIILDLPVDIAFSRVSSRTAQSRDPTLKDPYEQRDAAFHEALRNGFLSIAKADPGRCVVTDAAPPAETIAEQVWALVSARFPEVAA